MAGGKGRLTSGIRMVGTKKSLGQHWLKNREILEEIAELAAVGISDDIVNTSASKNSANREVELCIEVGPGLGTLTSSLLRLFNKVIAIEYDERLADNLPKSFPGKNLRVINADILEIDLDDITGGEKYCIAGNIPYYITSPIIKKVLTTKNLAKRVVLLLQKEVAERILSDKETILSLFVKNRADVYAGPVVKREEFTPPPKVNSEVIILEPHEPVVEESVFELIQTAFKAPRKKIIHNLAGLEKTEELKQILAELGINSDARPGDLHLDDYRRLHEKIL